MVEDNEDDFFFMGRAIAAAEIGLNVRVAPDGRAAVDYQSREGAFADREGHPRPVLVCLDLKLPHASGLEALRWARAQTGLGPLPILILTRSREESDVQEAYALGTHSFLVKPANALPLNVLVKLIRTYWLDNPHLALSPG